MKSPGTFYLQTTRSEQLHANRLRIGAGSQRGQVPRPCPPRPTLPNEIEWFEIAMNGLTLAFALPFRLRTFALTPVFFSTVYGQVSAAMLNVVAGTVYVQDSCRPGSIVPFACFSGC